VNLSHRIVSLTARYGSCPAVSNKASYRSEHFQKTLRKLSLSTVCRDEREDRRFRQSMGKWLAGQGSRILLLAYEYWKRARVMGPLPSDLSGTSAFEILRLTNRTRLHGLGAGEEQKFSKLHFHVVSILSIPGWASTCSYFTPQKSPLRSCSTWITMQNPPLPKENPNQKKKQQEISRESIDQDSRSASSHSDDRK
jgi:hypothetical protein